MTPKVSILRDARATLGEGPLWDGVAGVLWWVDIKRRRLHRTDPADPARDGVWELPSQPGCLANCTDGTLLVAAEDGLRRFDPADGHLSPPLPFETDRPGNRANDGKPGPDGAFWVGTMADEGPASTGGLWRLAPGAPPRRVLDGIGVSNSLCWSPDARTLYHADSRSRRILAYPFDPATGGLGAPRPLLDLAAPGAPDLPAGAVPDGAAVDAEGRVWVAVWQGGCILAVTPSGEIATRIDLPVGRPTCPAFGGPDLSTIFVASAAQDGPGPGGALLAIEGTGARGLPEPRLDWLRDLPPAVSAR